MPLLGGRWYRKMLGGTIARPRRDPVGVAGPASQSGPAWPDGFRAALSFSFDDARPSQIRRGLPALAALRVASTFFVLPGAVAADRRAWATVVERGHEIGNHTVGHPCSANLAWCRDRSLEAMRLTDMRSELLAASTQIHRLLDVDPGVFAYPCGQTFVGRGAATQSYVPLVAELFEIGRTFNDRWANSPAHCDLAQLACVNSDGLSFEDLRPRLEEALDDGAWLVLGGHEIGVTGDLVTTSIGTLETVVQWSREHGFWIDTIGAIGRHVASAVPNAGSRERAHGLGRKVGLVAEPAAHRQAL